MRLEILDDADQLAERAADVLAEALRSAVRERGHATVAVSGGRTPGAMLAALARREVAWARVHLLQVDERIAPDGHPERNLVLLRRSLLGQLGGPAPYQGGWKERPTLGQGQPADAASIAAACSLVQRALVIWLLAGLSATLMGVWIL